MNDKVTIQRSARRSVAISVNRDLSVTVKAPRLMKKEHILAFVEKNRDWISRRCEMQRRINGIKEKYSASSPEGRKARKDALGYLTARTELWAARMALKPSKIRLSSAEKRYGSCNSRGEIAYSGILMMYPEECIDAVIVHELAHLKHMNHGRAFYAEIEKIMPDYRKRMRKMKKAA